MAITLVTGNSLPFIAHLYSSAWPAASSFKRLLGPLLNRPKLTWTINGGQGPVTLALPAQLVTAGGPVPVNGDLITLTEDGGAGDVLATLIVEDLPDNLDVTVDHRIVGTPLIVELGMTPFSATYSGIDIAVQARAAVAATAHLTWDTASIPLTGITGTIAHTQTSLVALEDLRKIGGANYQFHVDQNGKVYFGLVSLASATYSVKVGTDATIRRYSSPATNRLNVIPVIGGIPAGATAPITAIYDNSAGSPLGKRTLNPPLTYPNITDQTTLNAIANYYGAALDHDHAAIELVLPGFGTLFSLAAPGGATVRYWEPAVWETLQSEAGSGTYSPNYVLQSVELDGPSQKILLSDIASALDELAFEVDRMLMRMAVAQPQSVQLGQVGVIPPGMLGGGTGGGPATPNTPAGLGLATSIENIAQVNNAQITASWTANPANENVVTYEIGIRKGGTTDFTVTRAASSPIKFAGLIPGQSYDVRIRSVNNLGLVSGWSSVVSLTSGADVSAPAVPTGLSAIKTPRGALVSWTGNAEADLQGYRLKVSVGGGGYSVVFDKTLTTSFAYVAPSGTAQNTSLTFEVAAVDWSGNYSADSAASAAVNTDGIIFDELLAGNLKVFGTLTTGGLQTAASGARVAFDSTSIRAYDGSATNWGAPSGAGVTAEIKNDGTGFFAGTVKSSALLGGKLVIASGDTIKPSSPADPATGVVIDPTNGFRVINASANVFQVDMSGNIIITALGSSGYIQTGALGSGVGGTGVKIDPTNGLTIYVGQSNSGLAIKLRGWNGAGQIPANTWLDGLAIYASTAYNIIFEVLSGSSGLGTKGSQMLFKVAGTGDAWQMGSFDSNDIGGTSRTWNKFIAAGTYTDIFSSNVQIQQRQCGFSWASTGVWGVDVQFIWRFHAAPTGITLTTISDSLVGGSISTNNITQWGFNMFVSGNGAGAGWTHRYYQPTGGS